MKSSKAEEIVAWYGAYSFSNHPTLEQQSEVVHHLQSAFGMTRPAIARLTGLSIHQVKRRLASYKLLVAEGKVPTGLIDTSDHLSALIHEEAESQGARQDNKLAKQVIFGRAFEEALIKRFNSWSRPPRMDKVASAVYYPTEEAVAVVSDCHFGLVTPEYNYEVAEAALTNYISKVIRITSLQGSPVRGLHLVLLGDALAASSGNFANQKYSCLDTTVDQVERTAKLFIGAIETLLEHFEWIKVPCSYGNHGRIGESKKTDPNPAYANFEYLLYKILEIYFRYDSRVEVIVPKEWYHIHEVNGVRFLLQHGQFVNSSSSYDGLVGSFRKYSLTLPPFDAAIIGHLHRLSRLPLPQPFGSRKPRTLYVNGCYPLRDEHAEMNSLPHTNNQWLFFVAPGRISSEFAIDLY